MGNSHPRISTPEQRESQLTIIERNYSRRLEGAPPEDVIAEGVFHSRLALESRRAGRSREPFVLMLFDADLENGTAEGILMKALEIAVAFKPETDLVGWYKQRLMLGIIFTEVTFEGDSPITETLRTKMETAFIKRLGPERASKISISMHIFPETLDKDSAGRLADSKPSQELKRKDSLKRLPITSNA